MKTIADSTLTGPTRRRFERRKSKRGRTRLDEEEVELGNMTSNIIPGRAGKVRPERKSKSEKETQRVHMKLNKGARAIAR